MNEFLVFDTIKIVTHSTYLKALDKSAFTTDIDLSDERTIRSVTFNSQRNRTIVPFELYIHANLLSGKMSIEFSSKVLWEDYPKLISSETFAQCLQNINETGICALDIDRIMEDCYVTKLHITKDVELELTPAILDSLNLCTGNFRRYDWKRYKTAILFSKNVKSSNSKEAISIYDKGVEIVQAKNRGFLGLVENADKIIEYFVGKTRFEVKLENMSKIKKELGIKDTSLKSVFSVKKNVVLSQFDKIFTERAISNKVKIETLLDFGIWNIVCNHNGNLKAIEQEIKDLGIYGRGSRAAFGRTMKRIKEMAQIWGNQEMEKDVVLEKVRCLLSQ